MKLWKTLFPNQVPEQTNFFSKLKFHERAISSSSFEKVHSVSSGGELWYCLQEDGGVIRTWGFSKEAFTKAWEGVLGLTREKKAKDLLFAPTWHVIDPVWLKLPGVLWTPSQYGCRGQLLLSCQQKDKEVKRSPRNDKRAYLEDNAACAERSKQQKKRS